MPRGPSLAFLQSVNFQAKEKQGRAEDEKEVKGRDKEVRVKLKSENILNGSIDQNLIPLKCDSNDISIDWEEG